MKAEPVDYLCKLMPERDLREMCQSIALRKAGVREKYIIVDSCAYIKKCNLMNDTAVVECW